MHSEAPADKVAVYEQLPSCTGDVTSLSLYSWTQPQLRARFGPRANKESFRIEERQGEFYNGIEVVLGSQAGSPAQLETVCPERRSSSTVSVYVLAYSSIVALSASCRHLRRAVMRSQRS